MKSYWLICYKIKDMLIFKNKTFNDKKNTGRRDKISCLLVLFCLLCVLTSLVYITPQTKPGDIGEPLNSYNLGYAKKLEGKTIIISLFVETPDNRWSMKDMKSTLPHLAKACEYIKIQAQNYDKDIEMVYDWTENTGLLRRKKIDVEASDENFEDELDKNIADWTRKFIPYERILKKYEADNIFTILYFNTRGRAYAICYDGEDIEEETLIVYNNSEASVFAHEMLHLFGAHDYYEDAEYSEEAVKYIKKQYPNDIMLSVSKGNSIGNTIGRLTAYHLGWIDEIEDTSIFKEFER